MFSSKHHARLHPVLKDPADFASTILGFKLWSGQKRMMRDVQTYGLNAVKACHASSKTFTATLTALHWLAHDPDATVINTAPTWRQVRLFWSELRNTLEKTRDRFPLPMPSATELKISEKRYIMGLSTSDSVKFQGIHGKRVLIITDEAPGIKSDIWDAIEGVRAGGSVHLLALGNPVVPGGKFFDAFTRERAIWNARTISAFDTPNFKLAREIARKIGGNYDGKLGHFEVDARPPDALIIEALRSMTHEQLGVAPWPFLVTQRWVAERLVAWGVNHPMFQARVLGEFPQQSDKSVFSLKWIERASHELEEEDEAKVYGKPMQIGVDVAGPGEDESALKARVGGFIVAEDSWREADIRGTLIAKIRELRARYRPSRLVIVIDSVGIGYHVWTHIAEIFYDDAGVEVYGFNAGARALDPEMYENAKAEAVWSLREWLERDALIGVADLETQAQLAGMQHDYSAAGRIRIEKKDDAKKRGQASPDRAEALMMAFAPVVPRTQTFFEEDTSSISPV